MNGLKIQVSAHPSPEDTNFLYRQLAEFNDAKAGPSSARELAVFARRDAEIVAGLYGFTLWNWLHIRYLWVAESLRHQGVARRLMLAAEQEALDRGCEHAHVDTFSFQAIPFYERLGYVVFGRLDDYPPGHSRVFLQKRDLPEIITQRGAMI